MTARRWRLSAAADADIVNILRDSRSRFGGDQMSRYQALLMRAADLAGEAPMRVGSVARDDLLPGLRSLHISAAARRRGGAAHLLLYVVADGPAPVLILRVLHERMDPARHLGETE